MTTKTEPEMDPELAKLIADCAAADEQMAKVNAMSEEDRKKWWRKKFNLPETATDEELDAAIQKQVEGEITADFANMSPTEAAELEKALADSPIFVEEQRLSEENDKKTS